MCGIAGALGEDRAKIVAGVAAMCEQMVPRGPDDSGIAVFGHAPQILALGSRRLSIIDISSAGHQPMHDENRGTTIVYNGMLYNFAELRRRLLDEGESFSSSCDTEVVLKAYGRWGADCVQHLRGMFAFAIWNERTQELFLARDRLGIKPVYYWQGGSRFLFASQVKALVASGMVPAALSARGISTFLDFGAVSDPLTAVEGVFALQAAHTALLRNGELRIERYWDFPTEPDLRVDRDEARGEFRRILEDAVQKHLVSDAPLGVFLSGGIDSSALAAMAARHTARLRTISVVFEEQSYSEEPYIEAMVARLRPEHVRVSLGPGDLREWSEDAFAAMDQPSFDGINTYVVSRAAADSGLKVALSGLGGDELFDGYGYLRQISLLERARRVPTPVTRTFGRLLVAARKGTRIAKANEWLSGGFDGGSYALLRRLFLPVDVRRLLRAEFEDDGLPRPQLLDPRRDFYGQTSILDLSNYTRNVLLRDTDAMSMACSLEVRVPFLDNELVEWVLRLPPAAKAGRGKAFLVEAVRDLLPVEVLERRKHGFLLPIGSWMRSDLREEVEATLMELPSPVRALIEDQAAADVWRDYLRQRRTWLQPWALFALSRWTQSLASLNVPGTERTRAAIG